MKYYHQILIFVLLLLSSCGKEDILRCNVSNPILFVDSINQLSIQLTLETSKGELSTQYFNNEKIITILTFENLDSVNSFYTLYKYVKPNNSLKYYHDSINNYLLTEKDIERRKWIANEPGTDGTYPTIAEPEPDDIFEIGSLEKLRYVLVSDIISNKAGCYNVQFGTAPIPRLKKRSIYQVDTIAWVVPETLKINFIIE